LKEINLAKTLISKRKEKGLTQDELAHFVGVSKASVSKWETGQSYPDITFLPKLAAYFDISLDELMGYEPQMSNENIRKFYKELSAEFSKKPFNEVKSRCQKIVKQYYSCYPLLFQIGVLFLNYGWTSKIEEQKISTIIEAKELFVRVKEQSNEIELKRFALHMEASAEMMLGNPARTIDLLQSIKQYPTPTEELLSHAYLMEGKLNEAKTIFQEDIFNRITGIFSILPPFLTIYAEDVKYFEQLCKRAAEIIKIFNLKKLCPTAILPFYLGASHGYLAQGNFGKAIDMLETYTELASGDIFPLKLVKTDDFFNLIDSLKEMPYGTADLPRDEISIKQSMVEAITENPAYSSLAGEMRFKKLTENLKKIIEKKGGK